jgi:hypothetical protein
MSTLLGSHATQWAALTGIVLPPLAGIVQKEEWRRGDDHFNSLLSNAVSALRAAGPISSARVQPTAVPASAASS